MDNIQGNLSTILVLLYAVLSPYISKYISQEAFIALCGVIIVVWSAYHPNTLKIFGNSPTEEEEQVGEEDGC